MPQLHAFSARPGGTRAAPAAVIITLLPSPVRSIVAMRWRAPVLLGTRPAREGARTAGVCTTGVYELRFKLRSMHDFRVSVYVIATGRCGAGR